MLIFGKIVSVTAIEKFKDTKGVIRSPKSKTIQWPKEKVIPLSTEHYTENTYSIKTLLNSGNSSCSPGGTHCATHVYSLCTIVYSRCLNCPLISCSAILMMFFNIQFQIWNWFRRGSDSMVVGFTATYAISAYRHLK